MVATISSTPTAPIPQSVLTGRGGLVQFTVDDVMQMIRQGLVAEDASAELLNGYIVHTDRSAQGGDPTMHSPGHRKAVRRLTALVAEIDAADRHVQIQSPIVCSSIQMPEPDFAVIRGSDDAYTDRLPAAADAFCVVEVADSSLERDRQEKLPIYARAGIVQYVILNLRNRTAEVYANPDATAGTYPGPQIVAADGSIALRVGDGEVHSVRLSELL
jgi:hypothetical protein